MAIFGFLKVPKHKTFSYQPRYYDERKEKLEDRIKMIEYEMGVNDKGGKLYGSSISGSFRQKYDKGRAVRKKSNIRLLIIVAVLLLLAYYILFS